MSGRRLTQIIIIAATMLVIVYDVIAVSAWGVDATVSRVTLSWAKSNPILPFAVGVVCGHLFWPQPKLNDAG